MNNPISWFEIYVNDIARAKTFYETVLAIELSDLTDPTNDTVQMKAFPANMEKYGASGALVKMSGVEAGNNSVLVYFACDDTAVEEARIEAAGGKIQRAKFSIGDYGFITLAVDTEGDMFGLHSLA
ncbi:VOC family protein [Alteromonas gilva]|uniref:VOC family protein n=1 Tax=Alteromonas gilva TaxID=2987522 RepID=A0ABT5KY04_9ALTE|nr:VOC family protein [Alteromonas gilva]MDC8829636.1 VOC family protein [Alteromonas gilva]